jgi:hypothetical protein
MAPVQIEVELRGGPFDGQKVTIPPALQYWASFGERWAVYVKRDQWLVLHYAGMMSAPEDADEDS